jgi:hypothetical protein
MLCYVLLFYHCSCSGTSICCVGVSLVMSVAVLNISSSRFCFCIGDKGVCSGD